MGDETRRVVWRVGVTALVLLLALAGVLWAAMRAAPSIAVGGAGRATPAAPAPPAAAPATPPATPAAPSPAPRRADTAPGGPASSPAVRPVEAASYWADYRADQGRADALYKGKALEVSGAVASTLPAAEETVIVVLAAQDGQYVHARMERSQTELASRLAAGQRVVLDCRGDGMLMQTPQLADCRLR